MEIRGEELSATQAAVRDAMANRPKVAVASTPFPLM
jgi:hypothetical protein